MAQNWAISIVLDAVASWEQDGRVYGIRHDPERNYPWVLEHASAKGAFGGSVPFQEPEALEEYMRVRGLRAPNGWNSGQLKLGI